MEIRKGPYGKFATEKLSDNEEIYEYAAEIIRDGIPGCFLPVYVNESRQGRELSYDISDLIPVNNNLSTAIDIRRNAVGDLFLALAESGNLLLDSRNILLNENYSYWNSSLKKILIPYRPLKNISPIVDTSGIVSEDLEELLKSPFFSDCLSLEEKDTITYAVKENNEEMLKNICSRIKATKISKDKKKNSDSIKILACSLIASLFTLFFMLNKDFVIATVFFLFTIVSPLLSKIAGLKSNHNQEQLKESSRRRSIFFEDKNSSAYADCLILEYKSGSEYLKKTIFTDRATIGSDCFLSDITIDDPSVEALHLEIRKKDSSYYIKDLSYKDSVMLDNHRIEKDRPYEIRDGQRFVCGNIEFKIVRGLK